MPGDVAGLSLRGAQSVVAAWAAGLPPSLAALLASGATCKQGMTRNGHSQPALDPGQAELRTVVSVSSMPVCTIMEIFLGCTWLHVAVIPFVWLGAFPAQHVSALCASLFVLEVESPGTPVISQGWAHAPLDLSSTLPAPWGWAETGKWDPEHRRRNSPSCNGKGCKPPTPCHAWATGSKVAKSVQDRGMEDTHTSTPVPGGSHHTE